MQGKWRWLLCAIMAWQFVRITVSAVSVPWSWTLDQCLFVLFVLCAAIPLVWWTFLWQREGAAAVKERWALLQQQRAKPVDKKVYLRSLVFWIAFALVLVVVFNMVQR